MGVVIGNKMYVSIYMYVVGLSACLVSSKDTSCKTPRNPENGTALYSSLEYNSELSYKCNEGYTLSSNVTRVCDVNGEWDGTEPLCEEIICEKPGHPTNGKSFYKSLKFGYETIYECNTGYRLSHSQSRACGPDGRWNGTEPFCQVVRCDIPENPENGEAQYISMVYDSFVWYKCHEGYKLSSRTGRKCGADGQWTRTKPFCKAISCRKPKNPKNGRALYISLKYKSELKYVCNIGHYLSSDETRICMPNGKWNGTESLCIVISCETPKDPRHGRALYNSTEYNAKLKYKCDEGYQLSIRYTRTCASDGKWTSSEPSCEDVKGAIHL